MSKNLPINENPRFDLTTGRPYLLNCAEDTLMFSQEYLDSDEIVYAEGTASLNELASNSRIGTPEELSAYLKAKEEPTTRDGHIIRDDVDSIEYEYILERKGRQRESWEGPHFDAYDLPFIANFARTEEKQYERRYVFVGVSIFAWKKEYLLDKYWFGDKEDELRAFADLNILPDTSETDRIVENYLLSISEGREKRPLMTPEGEVYYVRP